MKVKGFEKVIILHLGALFGAANAGEKSVKSFHRTLLNTPNLDEMSVHEFAAGRVSDLLAKHEVKDPIGYKTIGFAPYADYVGGKFAMGIPGTNAIVLQAEKRERVLPGVSVRNEVTKRMDTWREKEIEGWEPTRKDWAQLKDDVEAEMLKTAPIRPTRYNVIIAVPYVYVFTTSAKTAEEINSLLRAAFGTWPVEHLLINDFVLRQSMEKVVRGNIDGVTGDDFIHIKHDDGDDVKFKDIDIHKDEVVLDYLARHYTVRALNMRIDEGEMRPGVGNVFFRLTDKAIISGIHIGEADVDANYEATLERYNNDSGTFLTYMANLFQTVLSLQDVIDVFRDKMDITVEVDAQLEDDDEV